MKIIECPRDAMQGLDAFIPTEIKANYINELLKVGFDTIDFGSFVSPKAIPQLRDTGEVLKHLNLDNTRSALLAIVANLRGAQDALAYDEISYLGFPLSISEEFQQRNTNRSISSALQVVSEIQNLVEGKGKELVVYISMGFGNPYGEPFNEDIVAEFVKKLSELNISIISLSDTIGVSDPQMIKRIFETCITAYPTMEFGAHFHSVPNEALEKIDAAFQAGCKRFDAALKGFGGCPMAKNDLTGNIATETLLSYLGNQKVDTHLNADAFRKAMQMTNEVFPIS